MGFEQWVNNHNAIFTIVGTAFGIADPMIATWLDGRRSIQRAALLGLLACLFAYTASTDDVPIGWRLFSTAILLSGLAALIGVRLERWRRGERAPVPCEVLIDRQAIKDARFDQLRHADHSFDMMAVSGVTMLQDYQSDFQKSIARGVTIRVLLANPNGAHLPVIAQATSLRSEALREQIITATELLDELKVFAKRTGRDGCIDYKFYDQLSFYSIWLADKSTVNVQVFSYRGSSNYKAFRSTNRSMIFAMQKEFDRLWDPDKEKLTP